MQFDVTPDALDETANRLRAQALAIASPNLGRRANVGGRADVRYAIDRLHSRLSDQLDEAEKRIVVLADDLHAGAEDYRWTEGNVTCATGGGPI